MRIVKPESEFPELFVYVPDSWPHVKLTPLYDVHYGHELHADEVFVRHSDWLEKEPYVLGWNGGDLIENAIIGSPGIFSQKMFSQQQHEGAVELVAPYQHKLLFAVPGNHEARTARVCGFDIAKQFATDLQIPYFSDYCVAPSTRILTADLRWVPAENIEIEESLLGFDENSPTQKGRGRNWRPSVVTDKAFLRKQCYRIKMVDGTNLISSYDHQWLTYCGNKRAWQTTEELASSHRRGGKSGIIKVLEPWEEATGWGAGYLAAAFDGEGTLSQSISGEKYSAHALTFSQKDNPMAATVKGLLGVNGFSWGTNRREWGVNTIGIRGGVPEQLRFLGQMRPKRLLSKFEPAKLGRMRKIDKTKILEIVPIGEQWVVSLTTTTHTFIAEGFASHNCFCTIKWRGNNFRICAHHGTGAAATPGGQVNAARKDMPWVKADLYWTGHLHQPRTDLTYQADFDQKTGEMVTREAFVIISPSYLKYFGGYGAQKRLAPGVIGLTSVTLQKDGRMDCELRAKGKRL